MKTLLIVLLGLSTAIISRSQVCADPNIGGQADPYINISTPAGSIAINQTVPITVTAGNNGAMDDPNPGNANPLKANTITISVTVGCNANILTTGNQAVGQMVPGTVNGVGGANWKVTSNSGKTIKLTNNTDITELSAQVFDITAVGITPTGSCGFLIPSNVSSNVKYTLGGSFDPGCPQNGGAPYSLQGNLTNLNDNSTASITVNSTVLPVILSNFTIVPSGCDAVLNWVTTSEINVNNFDVEFSTDANHFIKVGSLPAKNAANGARYSFTYSQSVGYGYYRLKIIDRDGSYKYSQTIALFSRCLEPKVSLYPNPISVDMVSNLVVQNFGTTIKGKLTDFAGKTIMTYRFVNGINKFSIHGLASSQYVLYVQDEKNNSARLTITVAK